MSKYDDVQFAELEFQPQDYPKMHPRFKQSEPQSGNKTRGEEVKTPGKRIPLKSVTMTPNNFEKNHDHELRMETIDLGFEEKGSEVL